MNFDTTTQQAAVAGLLPCFDREKTSSRSRPMWVQPPRTTYPCTPPKSSPSLCICGGHQQKPVSYRILSATNDLVSDGNEVRPPARIGGTIYAVLVLGHCWFKPSGQRPSLLVEEWAAAPFLGRETVFPLVYRNRHYDFAGGGSEARSLAWIREKYAVSVSGRCRFNPDGQQSSIAKSGPPLRFWKVNVSCDIQSDN